MTQPAEIDHDLFRQRIAEGMSSTELAEEFGCSRTAVTRRARKLGIRIFGNKKVSVKTIRATASDMKPSDAVEYLLDLIEDMWPHHDDDLVLEAVLHGFTSKEAQLLISLTSDRVLTKEMAVDSLYAFQPHGEIPETKIIDVFVCKIRKKLRDLKWDFEIKTIWGRGYRGERLNGFMFPWELP